jgi:preprotein translocase subunit YajC
MAAAIPRDSRRGSLKTNTDHQMNNPVIGSIFMYGAIFAIFYFILIRPQAQTRKKHDEMVRNLKKGDEIVTNGGLIGEVLFIKEMGGEGRAAGLEDRVTIKSGDTRVIIERGRIARINRPNAAANSAAG